MSWLQRQKSHFPRDLCLTCSDAEISPQYVINGKETLRDILVDVKGVYLPKFLETERETGASEPSIFLMTTSLTTRKTVGGYGWAGVT